MPEPVRRPLARRAGQLLGALGLAGTFVVSAAGGLVLHADLPVARRLVARAISAALSSLLEGTVEIASLGKVTPSRVIVPSAVLYDTYGQRVLSLGDVRIDASARVILRDFVMTRGRPSVIVDHVRVERADVELLADPKTGEPTIARAIAPSPSPPGTPSGDGDGGTRVFLPVVEIGLVVAHARLENQPPLEAEVRSVRGQLFGSPKGLAVDVRRFGVVLRGYGTDARGTGTLGVRAPGPVRGTFEGFLGDVELKATAFLDGGHVEIDADIPGASPRAMSRVIPGWPLREPVSGHVTLKGDLPELVADARLRVAAATIDAKGPLHLGTPISTELAVESRHLDARVFVEEAPETDLTVTGTVNARAVPGGVQADVRAHTDATYVAEQRVPALDVEASIAESGVKGSAIAAEPGLPLRATFHVTREGAITVDAVSTGVDLARLDRSRGVPPLSGRGRAHVHATVERRALVAVVDADLSDVAAEGVRARDVHLQGEARGSIDALDELVGALHVKSTSLDVRGVPLDRFEGTASGSRRSLSFDVSADSPEGIRGRANGTGQILPRLRFGPTTVAIQRGPVSVAGEIAAFDPAEGTLDVKKLHVTGAGGTVDGSLRLRHDLVELEVKGENVDLDALAGALRLPRGTLGGKLRIDAQLTTGRDVTRGRVRLGLGNATIGTLGGISLSASADLEGEALTGEASGLVAGLGTFGGTADARLGGPAFVAASWRDVTGRAELQGNDLVLPLISAALVPSDAPVRKIAGRGYARVLLERKNATAPLPNVFAQLGTRGLVFEVVPDEARPPIAISGMDLSVTGGFDGTTGDSTGTVLVADAHGDLATASFAVRVDPGEWRADPARAAEKLASVPLNVVLSLPSRPIQTLPELIRPAGVTGNVSGTVSLRGSLARPTLFGSIDATKLVGESSPTELPMDLHADAQYEWNTQEVNARAEAALGGRQVATGFFRGELPDGALERWKGEGRVELDGLPVDVLSALAKSEVTGRLSGHAVIARDEGSHRLEADVHLVDAAIAHTSLGEGKLELRTIGDRLVLQTAFVGNPGVLEANGTALLSWKGPLPALSEAGASRLHVVTKDFGAIVFSPLLRGVLSRVGGRVDADVSAEVTPTTSAEGETTWDATLQGGVALREGTVLVDVLGLEARDLSFQADFRGHGRETRIKVRNVRGRVRSSKDNLEGEAELVLTGLVLTSGTASLQANDLPILFQGAPQGRVRGKATARLTREKTRMKVDVDVPSLSVRLPQSSARNVIDLSDNPDVEIVQLKPEETGESTALPWRLVVHLGSKVTLRRSDIDLGVTGEPVIDLGEETQISGAVDLVPGGRIPVLGKVFVVDHGRVVFDTGEANNPRVDVTAEWRAPNDTVVYVEVTGTLREAKVTLRSDPPLTEPEVFALLLGGSSSTEPSASERPGSGGGAAGAVALGSGVGVLGVNELLSDSPVELRVETTAESRPRYTAAVRVRPNLWFEASTYQQSQTISGSDKNVFSGTVDYRFTRRWSLRTEVGTSGGALDLLWQYRY